MCPNYSIIFYIRVTITDMTGMDNSKVVTVGDISHIIVPTEGGMMEIIGITIVINILYL